MKRRNFFAVGWAALVGVVWPGRKYPKRPYPVKMMETFSTKERLNKIKYVIHKRDGARRFYRRGGELELLRKWDEGDRLEFVKSGWWKA